MCMYYTITNAHACKTINRPEPEEESTSAHTRTYFAAAEAAAAASMRAHVDHHHLIGVIIRAQGHFPQPLHVIGVVLPVVESKRRVSVSVCMNDICAWHDCVFMCVCGFSKMSTKGAHTRLVKKGGVICASIFVYVCYVYVSARFLCFCVFSTDAAVCRRLL